MMVFGRKQKTKIALGVLLCVLGVSVGSLLPTGLVRAEEGTITRTSEIEIVSDQEITAENVEELVMDAYSAEGSLDEEWVSDQELDTYSDDLAAGFYMEEENVTGYAVEEPTGSFGGTYEFPANGSDGFVSDFKEFIQDADHEQKGSFVLSDLSKNQFVLYVSMNIDAESYRSLENESRSYQLNLASMDDNVFTWETAGVTSGDINIRINNGEVLYKIGTYQLLNGILTISFEPNHDEIFNSVTTLKDIYVGIGGSVRDDLFDGEYEYSIPGISCQLTVDLGRTPVEEETQPANKQFPEVSSKAGSYLQNSEKMHWTVKIAYGDLASETAMYFYDEAMGQMFVEGSFQVEGSQTVSGLSASYDEAVDKMNLSYCLSQAVQEGYVCIDDVDQDGFITISYDTVCSTKALQANKTTYQNEAYLNLDSSKKVSATCQVPEKKWMKKYGNYSNTTNIATWTLTIDKKNRSVDSDIVITDMLPEGIILDTSSVKCDKSSVSTNVNGNEITFVIPKEEANFDTAMITYKTLVTEQYILEHGNSAFVNQAEIKMTLTGGIDIQYGANGKIDVPVISLNKSALSYDEQTHRITWKVVLNERQYDYGDQLLTLKDLYERVGGMTADKTQIFVEDSLSMVTLSAQGTENKNVAFEKISTKTEPDSSDFVAQYYFNTGSDQKSGYDDELIFYIKNLGNQKLVFTYQTEVTNDAYTLGNKSGNFKNQIFITVGDVTTSVIGSKNIASNVLNKDVERNTSNNGNPYHAETATIDWKIEVNESKHDLRNIVVTDEAGAGHRIVENSVVITDASGKQIVLPGGSITYSADGKTMNIHFGNIHEHYTVHYQTKLVGDELTNSQKIDIELKNTVSMKSDSTQNDILATDEGSYKITLNDCEKKATYTEGTNVIHYEVLINASRKVLKNAVLTDVMGEGLSLSTNTVKLETKAGSLVNTSSYSYTYDAATRTLTMMLPNDSMECYVLKYDVTVEAGTTTASNTVTIKNGEKEYQSTHTVSNISVAESYAGGSGNGNTPSEKPSDVEKDVTGSETPVAPQQPTAPQQPLTTVVPQSTTPQQVADIQSSQEQPGMLYTLEDESVAKESAPAANKKSAAANASASKKKNNSDLVTIEDDNVPLAAGVSKLPKTGESAMLYVLWLIVFAMIIGGSYMIIDGKKTLRKERENVKVNEK